MAPTAVHPWQELSLPRRLFRFVLVSIIAVTMVVMLQTVVTYASMPKASKATHHARAACGAFVGWIDQDGTTGSPEAAPMLSKATEAARSAAAVAPKRWSALLEDLRAAAGPTSGDEAIVGPVATRREQAITRAIATCGPIVSGKPAS